MRATAYFRWGMTCLLLAPLAFLGWLLSLGGGAALQPATPEPVVALARAWGALTPVLAVLLVLAGGVLNALAIRRGVRGVGRVASGDWDAPAMPSGPRIIYPAGWSDSHPAPAPRTRLPRRTLGVALAAALLAWVAVIGWMLVAGHPLAMAQGRLTLAEVYAAWSGAGQAGFVVAVVVWAIVALLAVLAIAALGLAPRPALDRLLAPRRFVALTAIVGSALVVAALPAYATLGGTLGDDLSAVLGPVTGGGASAASWFVLHGGVLLSALAIVVTVAPWGRRARSGATGAVSPR